MFTKACRERFKKIRESFLLVLGFTEACFYK